MTGASAEELVTRLYTARFFRSRPVLDEGMRACLQGAAGSGRPLPVLLLWGVNEKAAPDGHDTATMTHLAGLLARIDGTLDCRTALTLVVCDSHGQVNCADTVRGENYAGAIAAVAVSHGWGVERMSAIWREAGISLDRVDRLAVGLDLAGTLSRLQGFAARHYRGGDAGQGARRYLAARLLEKPVLTQRFRTAIHLTAVEPALQALQPELPTFHIWTERKGCSMKPWFPVGRH